MIMKEAILKKSSLLSVKLYVYYLFLDLLFFTLYHRLSFYSPDSINFQTFNSRESNFHITKLTITMVLSPLRRLNSVEKFFFVINVLSCPGLHNQWLQHQHSQIKRYVPKLSPLVFQSKIEAGIPFNLPEGGDGGHRAW